MNKLIAIAVVGVLVIGVGIFMFSAADTADAGTNEEGVAEVTSVSGDKNDGSTGAGHCPSQGDDQDAASKRMREGGCGGCSDEMKALCGEIEKSDAGADAGACSDEMKALCAEIQKGCAGADAGACSDEMKAHCVEIKKMCAEVDAGACSKDMKASCGQTAGS